MPPFWPFKKKEPVAQVEETPPAAVVYKRGEDPNARTQVETDSGAYKDALALFGGGSSEVMAASDQSVHYDGVTSETAAKQEVSTNPTVDSSSSSTPQEEEPGFTWVHHTDGYHYKQHADGSFDPVAHTKNADGTYAPYS